MKKIILMLSCGLIFTACQNTNPPHGEEGHQCTDECKMMNEPSSQIIPENDTTAPPDTELKEHQCTSACKDGQHVFAHGEKEHQCSDACLKNNNP